MGDLSISRKVSFEVSDKDALWILGCPNFFCGPIAHVMRASGIPIECKSEVEQAVVMIWLLHILQEHPTDWRDRAANELRTKKFSVQLL